MIELRSNDGQIEGWHIRSALEARIIGRAAVLDDPNEATTLYLHHAGTEGLAASEVEFLDRDMRYGRLVIGKSLARKAEKAFRSVASSDKAWNGIQPLVARLFVEIIDAGRQEPAITQLAELPGPIESTQLTRRAA